MLVIAGVTLICECKKSASAVRMVLASFAPTIRSEGCSVNDLTLFLFVSLAYAARLATGFATASLNGLWRNRTGVTMCFDSAVGSGVATNQNIQNKVGNDLSPDEIKAIVAVLKEGDAVDFIMAETELPQAVTVAIVRVGKDVIGVGAIKQQRPPYATKIASAKCSGFSFDTRMHELGYVAVLKAHQGHQSGPIVDSLLKTFNGPLWATTFSDLMKLTLTHRGFVQRGKEWPRKKGKDQVSLWIRESK
jgi:hypothetical protein